MQDVGVYGVVFLADCRHIDMPEAKLECTASAGETKEKYSELEPLRIVDYYESRRHHCYPWLPAGVTKWVGDAW